jgi:hypothetical protein
VITELISPSRSYRALHCWLLVAGLILSGLYICWDLGVLAGIFVTDVTRISVVVMLLFLLTSVHCCYRSWQLSRQWQMATALRAQALEKGAVSLYAPGCSIVQDYLLSLRSVMAEENTLQAELMAERIRGSHQIGWFISGALIKLGLLGTVIGFVMMLSSISGLENLDISDIKHLMQQMTQGMGVAMNTTIVGLVSSMLLGVQYLLLDRSADQLVAVGIGLGQELSPGRSPG